MTLSNARPASSEKHRLVKSLANAISAFHRVLTAQCDDPTTLSQHLRRDAGIDPHELERKNIARAPLIR